MSQIPIEGYAVDGSCFPKNPGNVQWRGVALETGEQIFCSKAYPGGTNNVAEFLAICHCLAMSPQSTRPVYSDSMVARTWVTKGYCLMDSIRDEELRKIVVRANTWLKENPHQAARVRTWETKSWGENKADFGRK